MPDKIVTHADLETLRRLRNKDEHLREWSRAEIDATDDLLDRLIAAAEADAPPLPKGWVLHSDTYGAGAFWHDDGVLYERDDCSGEWADVGSRVAPRDRLTPLRPTIDEADLPRAVDAFLAASEGMSTKGAIRAAFTAAGVVIEP